jgi:flagellar hook-associated protein 2
MGISFNALALLNGNGINVSSIVSAILSPENATISNYQNQQTDLATQAGLLAGINNNLTSLASAATTLADPTGPLASLAATSSQPNILTATAQSTAAPGTHQIVVSSLATAGTLFTNPLTNGDTAFTAGDIKLQIGGASGVIHDIPITSGSNDTLNKLATYINAQGFGVTASVLTDTTGARLALLSQSSGTPGAAAITSNTTSLTFNAPVGGTNASLTVDGAPFSSASNTVTGAIPGVTLNLSSAAPATQVQVTVGPDTAGTTAAINTFVNAYNAVIGNLNEQFTVDPTTNAQGPLASDSSLRTLQSTLLQDASYSITGNSGLVNLASLGIDLNNDGTLTVNQTATSTHPSLSGVLATNPAAVQSFFQNVSSTGFANHLNSDLTTLTDITNGTLNVDIAGNTTQQKALTTQISGLQDRLVAQQKQLTLQYDQLNATLEGFPSLLQEVTAEINALNGNTSTPLTSLASTNTTPTAGTPTSGG